MDTKVPYMPSTGKIEKMLDAMQRAGVPDTFTLDFLRDLGFTSSNDRPFIKVLKYLGFLDESNRPQTPYREFVNEQKARKILARRLHSAFDDLFLAHPDAHEKTASSLKGWFKTKTGEGDSVADKISRTFKALADYADFSGVEAAEEVEAHEVIEEDDPEEEVRSRREPHSAGLRTDGMALVYRLEIHLPDTQNVETFRAIFRAMREELMG